MAGLRAMARPSSSSGAVVVDVRHGSRGRVGHLALSLLPRDLEAAYAAADRWADEHAAEVGARPEALAWSAFRAIASEVDRRANLSPSSPRSLRRADLERRCARRA